MDSEVVASDLIGENTVEFSLHVLTNHFPSPIDGFKRVKRRIIYTQNPEGPFSGMELIANTIRIHNYGDASIYDAGARMVDTFRSTFPLLNIIGKGGSYAGDKAASSRYTKFKLSDFCKEIFFSGINFKTIPTEPTEDLSGVEISYFIPKIPTALLYQNESVGFGYSSRTLPLRFENICDLVVDFVRCKDKPNWDYSKMAECFVPLFPIHVFIKNRDELIKQYAKGIFNAPIETEGVYEILSNNSVMFKTLAFGISPSGIRMNITKALKDKAHWLTKLDASFDALSEDVNYIDFKIMVKRGANVFELIDQLKGLMRIRSAYYPINNFVFDKTMFTLDPPEIIRLWYKERYRSILGTKKHKQQDLQLTKMRLETYLVICEYVDEVIEIIKSNETEAIYKVLRERFDLSMRQCEILLNANLQTLMKSKRDELEARLKRTIEEIEAINESFKHIDSEICKEVEHLKKRFVTNTSFTSRESEYVGALIVGNLGIIQVRNLTEAIDTANMFNGQSFRFVPYYSGVESIKMNKLPITYSTPKALPYTSSSSNISVTYSDKPFTFIRNTKTKRSLVNEGSYNSSNDECISNPVSDNPYVIYTNGTIGRGLTDQLKESRYKCADILYAFDCIGKECVVLSVNAAHPNVIRLQKIDPNIMKMVFSGAGETAIVGVLELGIDSTMVNLPEFHKNRIMLVEGINKLVSSKDKFVDVNIRMMPKR